MIKTVLGLDISSKTVGWGVLEINDVDGSIAYKDCGHFNPIKTGSIIERIVNTREKIKNILNTYKPDIIGIEDLIKFMPKSTATTVVMLTTFNRTISLTCYDYLSSSPRMFNVLSIRHGLKLNKKLPKKQDMPELVAHHLGITFPYVYSKQTKKKKPTIKEESYDIADGLAVALYCCFMIRKKK